MAGKTSRTKGHNYERTIMNLFKRLGWKDCATSRYASREIDDQKVDLVRTEPFNVQCKNTQTINFHTILSEMPKDSNYNVVFHKRTRKGTVVAMELDDFIEILSMLKKEVL